MSSQLQIFVLGLPRIGLAGRKSVAFVSARSQALLLYLAVTRQIHSRESLAALLWPNKSKEVGRQNLRDLLTKLRPLFSNYIITDRQTIGFNQMSPYWLDVEQLENAVITTNSQEPIEKLQAALDLRRGDFLENFFIDESNEFEEWVSEQRDKYRALTQRGLLLVLQRLTAAEKFETAIDIARELLKLEPLHEEGNQTLFTLLIQTGQRTMALQHFERYTQLLDDELGVAPSSEITALYEQLLHGDPQVKNNLHPTRATAVNSLFLRNGSASKVGAERLIPNNLPQTMTPFLGRKEEIAAIQERLASPNFSLVTIMGEGGMGKSRLALAVSEAVMPLFEDGVWFVPLAEILPDVAAESRIAAAIGRALNLPFVNSEELIDQLMVYLHTRKMLLVLDNFEHLMSATGFVLNLLRSAPQVKVLVTSRQRLNFQIESLLRLEGLPTPPANRMSEEISSELLTYDSIALFVERAQRVSWRFRLSDGNTAAISRICQFVEGMPLAIELAATLVEKLSVQEIDRRLQANYQVLESVLLDLSPRQRSIRALLDYSWQFLNETEQQALARCGLFLGGFSFDAAMAVANASEQTLERLEQKSLLRKDQQNRYDMHELVRQFAADTLSHILHEEETIRRSHCEYFTNFIFQREAQLGNAPGIFSELAGELPNLQQAWQYAVASAQLPLIRQSRQGLFTLYNLSGLSYEAETTLRSAIARMRVVIDESDLAARSNLHESTNLQSTNVQVAGQWQNLLAELLIDLANVCEVLGKLDEAEHLTDQAITLLEQSHNDALLARAHLRVSANAWARGNYQLHRQALDRSLALAQASGQFFVEANALCGLGNSDAMHDQLEAALANYDRSLSIARVHGFRQLENMLVGNAGVLQQLRGDFTLARANFHSSLAVSQALGDRYGAALAYVNLGALANTVGEYKQSLEHLLEALASFQEIGSQRMEADVLVNLALTHHYLDDQNEAIRCCKQALSIAQAHRFLHIDGPARLNLGRALEAARRNIEAKQEYELVLELQSFDGPANNMIVPRCGLARLALEVGNTDEAMALIEPILPSLNSSELYAGPDEAAVCLTAYHVLAAVNDQRARTILVQGAEHLRQQIEKIEDAQLHKTFVEQVPMRRELMAMAAQINADFSQAQ